MSEQTIGVEQASGVRTLTLRRPASLNALSLAMGRALFAAVIEADEDPEVSCIVLTGSGRAFCAGGDVKEFAESLPRAGLHIKQLTTYLHGAISRLVRSEKPVVAAVNGIATGGGLGLALSGDVVIAATSARFTMAYSKIALPPDGSASYLLPRLIGLRRTMELYTSDRALTADEAHAWGLVTRVVADADLRSAADAQARALGTLPREAFARAKRLFNDSLANGLETQMALEAEAIAASGNSAAFAERIRAFLAKRG